MNPFVKYLLLAEGFAVTTYGAGWWSVPVVAALWGFFSADRHRARNAAVAAAGGWGTLLLLDVARGPVSTMGAQLGALMGVPSVVLYLLTLLFPALMAWAAATLVHRPASPAHDPAPTASSS